MARKAIRITIKTNGNVLYAPYDFNEITVKNIEMAIAAGSEDYEILYADEEEVAEQGMELAKGSKPTHNYSQEELLKKSWPEINKIARGMGIHAKGKLEAIKSITGG